jgi:ketosteroid isomerase-like protein
VAEAFSNTRSEKEFLAPNAIWWAAGVGYIDPEKFFTTKHGPDRGPPLSYKNTVHGITVEGDRAAIEMSHLVVWPDFTYDQHYHNLIVVRNGKICLLKMFTDTSMSKKLVPDLKGTPEIPK